MNVKLRKGDRRFIFGIRTAAFTVVGLILAMTLLLWSYSSATWQQFGANFIFGSVWNPVETSVNPVTFGALPYIWGTIVTSVIAVAIALPLALGSVIFITTNAPRRLATPVAFAIELLAAIPSIAFGMWGLFVLVPLMRSSIDPFLAHTLGKLPILGELFKGPTIGMNFLTGGVILAIMILPTILSVSREIVAQVPKSQTEGMLALGTTKWEVVRHTVLPYARTGIIGATVLGMGRAIGETMAVTMVIGNSSSKITASLFTPGYTIASAIANQFTEADTQLYFSAIVGLALILLATSALFNIGSRFLVKLSRSREQESK